MVFLLPLRASPEVLHWCGIYSGCRMGWVVGCWQRQPQAGQLSAQTQDHFKPTREDACCLRLISTATPPTTHHPHCEVDVRETCWTLHDSALTVVALVLSASDFHS
jgi:hypothetical protein